MSRSRLAWISSLDRAKRASLIATLEADELAALTESAFDWRHIARKKQIRPDGDWLIWLLLAGRGFGKTRTGAEYIRERVCSGEAQRITIAAPTHGDLRDIVIEGESGLLSVFPPHQRPHYEPSKRRVTFHTGARATCLSADKPDRFRGVQSDTIWADELAAWRYPEAWHQLMLGFRLGSPQGVVTTTPRPTKLIKDLVADPTAYVTRGSTFENERNLAPAFLHTVTKQYEGTRMGRQELHAEVLDAVEGALLHLELIDRLRVKQAPDLRRIVVALDPASTSNEDSDETGIIIAGVTKVGEVDHGYILEDYSKRATPNEWAKTALRAFDGFNADLIVAESNQGGEMIQSVIRSVRPGAPVKLVHATRGKHVRFEPVAALYEQGRIHHVGTFAQLEDQLCSFTAEGYGNGGSPDRADAAVWAITELMVKRRGLSPGDLYGDHAYAESA